MTETTKPKRTYKHATHQRVKDEAKTRLGRKTKIIHVRVSEAEHEALMGAMRAAGAEHLSLFLRSVILRATEQHFPVQEQSAPVACAPAPATMSATADSKDVEAWLFAQEGAEGPQSPQDGLDRAMPVQVAPAPPERATEPPRALPRASRPAPPPVVPPPAPPVASDPRLKLLHELRSIMGDDQRVDASVRSMLDGNRRPE